LVRRTAIQTAARMITAGIVLALLAGIAASEGACVLPGEITTPSAQA
jgi:hypothetical protein